jgi:cobalamin biosynthesis Mg chelatase CobN
MSTDSTAPDAIREEIEQTRAELADTVDALHAKLDVKTRAQQKAVELKGRPAFLGGVAALAVAATVGLVWWKRR